MKLGIFSDIHGNWHSFSKIYDELKRKKCDKHLFLGDVCGYYFQQDEVIDMLRDLRELIALAGNHDVMFLRSIEDEWMMRGYTERFGLSFKLLKENIKPENLQFLQNLKRQAYIEEEGIAAFHGSPWSPLEEYVYHDSSMERFANLPYRVVFLGHTHRNMDITQGKVRIINPGSAGQPRDGKWPTYAIYDTQNGKLSIERVKFDKDALIADIRRRNDTNEYLIDVLKRIK